MASASTTSLPPSPLLSLPSTPLLPCKEGENFPYHDCVIAPRLLSRCSSLFRFRCREAADPAQQAMEQG
eukprot:scaffold308276_cov18-Tisochrysis_lutea.AAC.1